jgi:hypothetical protein
MDMIVAVGNSLRTQPAELPSPARHDEVAGSDFSALLAQKRQQDKLAGNPLVQAVMRISETHRNTLTERIASSFERDQKVRSASDRFVNAMEDLDAVMVQKSKLGLIEVVGRSTIKNIETLTTKMS